MLIETSLVLRGTLLTGGECVATMSTFEAHGRGITTSDQSSNDEDDKDTGQDAKLKKPKKIKEKLKNSEKKRNGRDANENTPVTRFVRDTSKEPGQERKLPLSVLDDEQSEKVESSKKKKKNRTKAKLLGENNRKSDLETIDKEKEDDSSSLSSSTFSSSSSDLKSAKSSEEDNQNAETTPGDKTQDNNCERLIRVDSHRRSSRSP